VTVSEARHDAARALQAAGVPHPDQDAERLLRHVLGWDRATLEARAKQAVDEAVLHQLRSLVADRSRRVPLQHLVGSVEFWRREFLVSPAALIPRPETELLLESALELLEGWASPVVVDVGTGSGCIALSIAADRPDADVHAVDVSSEALELAQQNARRLGVAGRVSFHLGDLLEPIARLAVHGDVVVSNPPYLDESEIDALAPEVRDHDPRLALLPPDGDRYSIYRRLAPQARGVLRPGGALLLEIGPGMEDEVRGICRTAGLDVIRVLPDLQSIPRVVVARKCD